jgi:hypothetical protein
MWVIVFKHKKSTWVSVNRRVFLSREDARLAIKEALKRHPDATEVWIVKLPAFDDWGERLPVPT